MSKPKTIQIDNVEYVRKDSVRKIQYGGEDRGPHIVVLDRGFIYQGDLTVAEDGLHTLTDCVNVRKWERGGVGGLTLSAVDSGAVLDPSRDIVFKAPIFVSPVSPDWRG